MQNKNFKQNNNLLQARRRSGLEPKQIAFLLSKRSTDELYRYENGKCYPNLPTLLKLEIIYQTPPRLLFQNLFDSLRADITEKRNLHPHLFSERAWFPSPAEQLSQEEQCFYAAILKSRFPSSAEMELITKHVIALTNTLSDYKQSRNPFSLQSKL
jgi:transcriptional regulator with XRE-family HTH domain